MASAFGASAFGGTGGAAFDFADLGTLGWALFAGTVFGITVLEASRTIPFTWLKN